MGRLPKRLTDNLPDLPSEFVEWMLEKGIRVESLSEIAEQLEEWKKERGDAQERPHNRGTPRSQDEENRKATVVESGHT